MRRTGLISAFVLVFVVLFAGCDLFEDDDDDFVTRTVDRQLTGELAPIGECEGDRAGWTKLEFAGTGVGEPFGETTVTVTTCLNATTGQFDQSEGVIETEDGDQVFFTMDVVANFQTGAYTDTGEFTDGTGDFEDAQGTFTGQGMMDLQFDENGQLIFPITASEQVTGEVTYRE